MPTPYTTEPAASGARATTTRRTVLAAGALAVGGLSGCLGRVASAVTETGASPAAFYGGDRRTTGADGGGDADDTHRAYHPGEMTVRHVPSRIRGEFGPLSGRLDLDGWTTSAETRAQNHNSSRSNRTEPVAFDDFDDDDSDGDGVGDGTEEDVELLFDYLGDEPVIAERFVVAVPDARLPGGAALADELTPARLVAYLTGDPDDGLCGRARRGEGVVHRDIACRNVLSARLVEETDKGRLVRVRSGPDGVVVTGTDADDPEGAAMAFVTEDGGETSADADDWGREVTPGASGTGGESTAAATATLVCPVYATPPGCPTPMPALLHLRRCRHDGQLLFAGGWTIDDGALYADAATLLGGGRATAVVGVSPADLDRVRGGGGDLDGDGYGDLLARRTGNDRDRHGATLFSGVHDPDAAYLTRALREGLASENLPETGVVAALDAPLVHLVAASASNEVKFKAGAELSGQVN
ncbi:hypothetical protein [Halobaculum marinum]|uniref:FG-GAP repeat-containing protein n=1 Tax=Halobaculum marinum TaxID=3031996 RepID=A0ABD5WZT3_9EURY|nr:hypothetical protein [Halobaculum sp. DT55]